MITIARWLGPEEMGIYAVAALAMATLETFSETGLRQAIIQRPGDISPYLLPVRTVQAVRGLAIGLGVYIAAPFLASFFHSPNSVHIVRVISLLPIINGFEPLYLVLARKELRFKTVVILEVTAAFISLVVGITAAYLRPDAWSLVYASLTGAMIQTIGAHLLTKDRSLGFSFNWRPLKDIRNFGFWIFVFYILMYVFSKGGDWMIGRLLDVKALALYQMSFLICTTVPSEIGGVISQLSFPLFSQLQNDKQRLQTVYLRSFGLISILTFCLAGLVVACAPDFYSLVLGEKWILGLPMVPWLVVYGVCSVFLTAQTGVIAALNRPKINTMILLYASLLFGIGIYPMTRQFGTIGVAALLSFIGLLMQLTRYWVISNLLELRYYKVIKHIVIPTIASVISIIVTYKLRNYFASISHLNGFVLSTLSVVIIYFGAMMLGSRWMNPTPKVLIQQVWSMYKQSSKPTNDLGNKRDV